MLDPNLDSGDHVHPSATGYSKMAASVDLASLRGARCVPPLATKLRVRVRGRLIAAAPTDCTAATVTVRALRAGRTIFKRRLRVTAACRFAANRTLDVRGKIEVRVSFAGTPGLLSTIARSILLRAR